MIKKLCCIGSVAGLERPWAKRKDAFVEKRNSIKKFFSTIAMAEEMAACKYSDERQRQRQQSQQQRR